MLQSPRVLLCLMLVCAAWVCAGAESRVALNDELYLGPPVQIDNVTAWPVFSKKPAEAITEYLTLTEAQEQKLAEVRETGVAAGRPAAQPNPEPGGAEANGTPQQAQRANQQEVGGQVNTLIIENKGEKPILVLAGTLVKGGKQDRQIAQDFIIPPKKAVPVGAFCVEHGRWAANREGNATNGLFQAQEKLAVQPVRDSAQFKGDQGAVWDKVAKANASAGKAPQTATLMAAIEDDDKDAQARRGRISKTLAEKLAALAKTSEQPLGLAYAIDGKVREVRAFSHPAILQRYTAQVLNTIAIEGDLAQRQALAKKQAVSTAVAESSKVVELIAEAEKLKKEEVQTQASNINVYQRGSKLNAAKAYLKDADAEMAQPVVQTWSFGE